jgi:hypothetical protein
MKEKIIEHFNRLSKLKYSEENIAELYSIIKGLISDLQEIDNDRKTNKCLHYIMLTHKKEFESFETAPTQDWKHKFNDAKRNILSDLMYNYLQYWNPLHVLTS